MWHNNEDNGDCPEKLGEKYSVLDHFIQVSKSLEQLC